MSGADGDGVFYHIEIPPGASTPLQPGDYVVRLVEGGTYRNLASRRKYTIETLDYEKRRLTYRYTRNDGEAVERTGRLTDLSVVEAVGDTARALFHQPDRGGVA